MTMACMDRLPVYVRLNCGRTWRGVGQRVIVSRLAGRDGATARHVAHRKKK